MNFQVLEKYSKLFPQQAHAIFTFKDLFNAKLWNELSIAVLSFLFNPQSKGKVGFDFYTDFVSKFQKSIDPINLLKVLKEVLVAVPQQQKLQFLKAFEQKQTSTQQAKAIIQSLTGSVLVVVDFNQCSQLIHKIQKTISTKKVVDPLVYSTFYQFCMAFYKSKSKYKSFYSSALQYLAYTPVQEMAEAQKVSMLVQMAVAALVSNDIYNFSELLEQPSLVSLKKSNESWMYELLQIFNKGDIDRFQKFDLSKNDLLVKNKKTLEQKIRIMKFLDIVFNLPKSDRVIKFNLIARLCAIQFGNVELMIMKTMALGLIRGSIDQLNEDVTVSWIAPKVLQNERIGVMLSKFEQWDSGVQKVCKMVQKSIKL